MVCAALTLSFLLVCSFRIPVRIQPFFWECLLAVIIVKPVTFAAIGFYRNLWSYASLQDAVAIFKGVTIASVFALFSVLYLRNFALPSRSIFILDWFFIIFI